MYIHGELVGVLLEAREQRDKGRVVEVGPGEVALPQLGPDVALEHLAKHVADVRTTAAGLLLLLRFLQGLLELLIGGFHLQTSSVGGLGVGIAAQVAQCRSLARVTLFHTST